MLRRLIGFSLLCVLCIGLTNCSGYSNNTAQPTSHTTWLFSTYKTIWPTMTSAFTLDHVKQNPAVAEQINWYQQHPALVNKIISQASPFLYYILQEIKQRELPGELALLPFIESGYDPTAYSYRGAAGLWQLMPGTASGFGITQNWWYDGRRDVYDSTKAALNYLTYLRDFFDNDWLKAIAAYNSGEGTVQNAVHRNSQSQHATDFFSLHLPKQTEAYVPKLLALAVIISHPKRYHIDLPFVANKPTIASVDLDAQIDLAQAAKLAEVSEETIYQINPGYMRWATDPSGGRLFLPIEQIATFNKNLQTIPKTQRVTWQRHPVVAGDSLIKIAKRYDTTLPILRKVNNLHNNTIRIGDKLIVPASAHSLTQYNIQNKQHYVGKTPKKIPGPKKVVHTVKPGETLTKIAVKYHLHASQLRFWNHTTSNHVAAGTKLTVWIDHYRPHIAGSQRYTVKAGDTLSTIAKRYHTSTHAIQVANRLASTTIKRGQTLQIQSHLTIKDNIAYYTVRAGDTLSQIAKRYHLSTQQLMADNKLTDAHTLRTGQRIKVKV